MTTNKAKTLTRELICQKYNKNSSQLIDELYLIEWEKCDVSQIAEDALLDLIHLQVLSLRYNRLKVIDAAVFRDLVQLQELWLSENSLTEIDPNTFDNLKKLKKLWCQSNKLAAILPNTFHNLFNLRVLWLADNKITQIYANTFNGLSNLQELFLNDNSIREIASNGFAGLKNLVELNLSNNRLALLADATFDELTSLKELYLHSNRFLSLDANLFCHNLALNVLEIFSDTVNDIKEIRSIISNAAQNEWTILLHRNLKNSVFDLVKSRTTDSKNNYKYKESDLSNYLNETSKSELSKSFNKGQFKTIALLGSGNFGKVFLVHDFIDNKRKSLKILFNSMLSSEDCTSSWNEANFLKKFNNPHIIKYADCFFEKDLFCIVIEYCDTGDLKGLISFMKKNNKSINVYRVFRWTHQLVSALDFLHANSIIHRDVKPANIFLNGADIKLGDLGLARNVDSIDKVQQVFSFVGTFNYMSPELINNQGYLFKSDIWSAGCVLFEMITLEKLFKGSFYQICHLIVESAIPPIETTPVLEYLLNIMLQKDTEKRWDAARIFHFTNQVSHLIKNFEMYDSGQTTRT